MMFCTDRYCCLRAQIIKKDFGKTLFDTIQIELQQSEPLDRLLETLANIEQQYQ